MFKSDFDELLALSTLMKDFTEAMEKKMTQMKHRGYKGWAGGVGGTSSEDLKERMLENIADRDWVDVANLAMILWYREE